MIVAKAAKNQIVTKYLDIAKMERSSCMGAIGRSGKNCFSELKDGDLSQNIL